MFPSDHRATRGTGMFTHGSSTTTKVAPAIMMPAPALEEDEKSKNSVAFSNGESEEEATSSHLPPTN